MMLRNTDTRTDHAFTLLELLAVIVLMSIMVFVSSMAFRSLATGARQGAAETLLSALDSARSEAVLRNEPWPILFRRGAEFSAAGSFSEYGLLTPIAGTVPRVRRVTWSALPKGAWLYGGAASQMPQGSNALGQPVVDLAELGVKAEAEDIGSPVSAIVFGEVGEVIHPESPAGPLYLAVAEGNPDAIGGTLNSVPDIIEIRPGSGRCQLLNP